MKTLVLAEKPSVAREIARVLKCDKKGKGFQEGAHYVVTWALGHLVTLAEPEDYDPKLREWRMEDLPMLPPTMKLKVIRQSAQQFQAVKSLMQRGDIKDLVIATDAGREGELVARWIMVQARWHKPFRRLWISSQTDAAIRDGFAALKPGPAYDPLYHAAVCRAEADWLIGINVTRALSCKFNAQLSAGRVQTPTLAMIVQREQEIKNFVPVDYWTIRADFGDYFGDWRDRQQQGRIWEQAQAEALLQRVQGQTGVISEVRTEAKSEPPPLAYDLTELQRDANRRYGFSAQQTLSVLQGLYEQHKLVTYPRTDCRYLTSDLVPSLPGRLRAMAAGPYAAPAEPLLGRALHPGKRLVDNSKVSDHHAIIPTEQPLRLATLNAQEQKLYDLIARRFLAVLYPPFRYEQTTVLTVVNGERFYARGKVVTDSGWRKVTTPAVEKEEGGEETLPEQTLRRHHQGERVELKNCKLNRAKTRPPGRYTEATLLTAMEGAGKFIADEELREAVKGSGLGTPATRAEIIEKLIKTFYIERHGKELVPTSKGRQLIQLAPPTLRSPELTARWEQQLADIARGRGDRSAFMTAIRSNAQELVQGVMADTARYQADNVTKSKCPTCGRFMLRVNGKRGRMLVCPERSCGHRQPEQGDDPRGGASMRGGGKVNPRLLAQYSEGGGLGQSLGELLQNALQQTGREHKE